MVESQKSRAGVSVPSRTASRGLALGVLALGLGACEILNPPVTPRVISVNPANGATSVPLSSNVVATLSLPGDAQLDVTTLTDTAVTLTDSSGAAVAGNRFPDGNTLVFDPDTDLELDTSYTFNVTADVRTATGTPLQPFSSTFSTGETALPPGGLVADRTPVVFTAGGSSSSDTRTVTLTNSGAEAVSISSLTIGGEDAAQFALTDAAPSTLAPGATRDLSLTFTPGSNLGPQLATLTVASSGAASLEIPLGGLGVAGQGGNQEPSLQYILDTYGLGIDTGDENPASYNLVGGPTNGGLGDEVPGQFFTKAVASQPVTAQVLAAFGVENTPVVDFGYYTAGTAGAQTEVFSIAGEPGLNEQRLNPAVTATSGTVAADGIVTFDPGAGNFGLYSFWPTNRFFDERTVYTEDDLNTFPNAIQHHVRTYPLVNADGTTEPNAYVVATEEFTQGFDYNDVVIILRNVVAGGAFSVAPIPDVPNTPPANGIAGLTVRNPTGLPYPDRLILQKIQSTTGGNTCDPTDLACNPNRWEGIQFPTTGQVTLQNNSTAALQLSLSIQNDNLFVINGPTTLTLQPGASYNVGLTFSPQGFESKGVYPAGLVVQSGGQSAGIELRGLYLIRPEGSREVFLAGMVNDLFGYNINLGANRNGGITNPEANSSLAGEEIRSDYWQAANPASPVTVVQLAAFQTCCNPGRGDRTFQLVPRGSSSATATMVYTNVWSQSVFPVPENGEAGELTQLSATPTGAFDVRSAGFSSNPDLGRGNGRLGVRFWPLKDRSGNAVENSYIVAQDFVQLGCPGSTPNPNPDDDTNLMVPTQAPVPPEEPSGPASNCDYNDNLYLIMNVQPAN